MSTNIAVASTSSPPSRNSYSIARRRDVGADVVSEDLAHPLTLAEAVRHPVEAHLQDADLAGFVHRHLDVELAPFDGAHPRSHLLERIGDRARRNDRRDHAGATAEMLMKYSQGTAADRSASVKPK